MRAVVSTEGRSAEASYVDTRPELAITSTGVLTFASAPDFETKASYTATVTATDGVNETTQDITVTVTNVNDVAPVITSMTSLSADENQLTIGTVTAADVEGNSFTFTVSGSELAITSAGVLTFVTAPDYETRSSFTATVTVSDGLNSSSKVFTITVNDLDEIPETGYRVLTSIDVIETKE